MMFLQILGIMLAAYVAERGDKMIDNLMKLAGFIAFVLVVAYLSN